MRGSMLNRVPRAVWAVFAALVLTSSLAFVASAAPASAQTCQEDPYGGGEQCPRQITLVIDLEFGPAGTRLRIRAYGFNPGDAVTLTFDGVIVYQGTAQPGTGQTALGQQPLATAGLNMLRSLLGQADEAGGIDQTITVPDKPPATYPVCVSGSGAQACGSFRITAATEVLGNQFERGGTTASGGSTASGGTSGTRVLGRTFARTGVAIATLVLLAVILILVGRYLLVASRRRRRVST